MPYINRGNHAQQLVQTCIFSVGAHFILVVKECVTQAMCVIFNTNLQFNRGAEKRVQILFG